MVKQQLEGRYRRLRNVATRGKRKRRRLWIRRLGVSLTPIAGALNGIVSNAPTLAAPEIKPEGDGSIKVGGNVKEPRLLSRVMPEYPLVAKEAGIQGDVVIKTTIDAKGNVVNVQIVVGPADAARTGAGGAASLEIRAVHFERRADRGADAGDDQVQSVEERRSLTPAAACFWAHAAIHFTPRFSRLFMSNSCCCVVVAFPALVHPIYSWFMRIRYWWAMLRLRGEKCAKL